MLTTSRSQKHKNEGSQARGFYEKHGYRVIGQVDDYSPGHMRKDLK